jgi:hypothetical protein
MTKYCIQYEAFDDPDWTIESHTMRADSVEITDGIAHFSHQETGEAFLVPAENLIAAWSHGDE